MPSSVPPTGRLDQARAQWTDQLQAQLVSLRALQAVLQELGVEADLEPLALKLTGSDSEASPTSGVCAETVTLPILEREPQRRVALRHQADATHDRANSALLS